MPAERGRVVRRALEACAAVVLAVALIAFALPQTAGASWTQIGNVLSGVRPYEFALLALVWLGGLALQTIALAAALPGLSHLRAFFLNITGSSVSNLVPLGGAAGTAVNWWSCRRWGFSTAAFVRWAMVTNIWDVLTRLLVPGFALAWLGYLGLGDDEVLLGATLVSAGTALGAVGLTVGLLRTDTGARRIGAGVDHLAAALRRPPRDREHQAVQVRRDLAGLVATAWVRLTVGKVLYALAQAGLLWLCLEVVGTSPTPAVVFAAFAVERVLSLAVITPGATGFVEIGMTTYLARMGTDPATAAAGVLLYRFFVIGMEVPVGGMLLLPWSLRQLVSKKARERDLATAISDVPGRAVR
ncbi:lysylphosphatidylglycerol synthase transmembrane domain-containing protein [Pedococcus sp. KACC 23699]|uniref:Lysylphosphatidylglycerol synthase transmembrane domain-containing protein n=1 Tax=Pedococcus sp. KACC 23699 TaxID=3149228 RepID=A0AAU7JTT7_9MICO